MQATDSNANQKPFKRWLHELVRLKTAVGYIRQHRDEPLPIKHYGGLHTFDMEYYIGVRRYSEQMSVIRSHPAIESILTWLRVL